MNQNGRQGTVKELATLVAEIEPLATGGKIDVFDNRKP